MRTKPSVLAPFFRSDAQGKILAAILLAGAPEQPLTNVARDAAVPLTTVLREVDRLEKAGVVRTRKLGQARLVSADEAYPLAAPLAQIVAATYGPLPAVDSTTNVTLDSLIFYSGPDIAGCINPMIADSTFSLIMQCGNATVRGLMQGKGIIGFVRPAIPDPVSGSNVTFTYTNEVAANLTLTIYDVLGREVARPIDNLRHEAGSWQISYNVAKLPNGTYTYRLSTDGYRGHEAVSKQFIIAR